MSPQLPLHQEVLLLALNERKGTFVSGMFLYSVAGAMVSELLIQNRIVANDDKDKTVSVVNDESTGHQLLDELLHLIQSSSKPKGLTHWVGKAAKIRDLPHRIAQQLCDAGILKKDEKKVLWLFTQRVYPEVNGSYEDAIRAKMAEVMFDADSTPDGRTAVLIALASHASLLKPNFAPSKLDQYADHIKALANGDVLASGATQETIKAVHAAIIVATIVPMVVATTVNTNH